ncbi:Phosphoenolpyruvate carboxykinase [Hibiscus syriacus]|uniref:phosphoenolpyruvate carboxykinase (ATP) n=1 Tax=Hibiscus syriacus TaxID=106335 RepID=A0A6A2XPN4_HIBSY|nr:Phosphoenolpyruvate carboxykinase [Hibiscus syriacus]
MNWDPKNRIKVRIVSARAYHSLFMHMCIRPSPEELENFGTPDFTIYNAGQFPCNRYTHYMTSSPSIDLNLARREMVILGTQYAGEMKGLFSVMHYLMPKRQILSLHSGCNMGKHGDAALFFGLSGTGKTTLYTDHNRYLIGVDEHCWSDNGVSNVEGGCYAKCIDLSRDKEPDIWNAFSLALAKFYGSLWPLIKLLQNSCKARFDLLNSLEHSCSLPIEYIPNAKIPCVGPHPKNVVLLACDAIGVLPPVSKLSLAQTMYHFISGYTALVGFYVFLLHFIEASASCSLRLNLFDDTQKMYAAMLAEKMLKHGATVAGQVEGNNRSLQAILPYTRKIIDAIDSGSLLNATYRKTEVFGLDIPTEIEGVPSEILHLENTETLLKLAGLFKNNFETFTNYKIGKDKKLTEEILAAGPNF